MKIIFERTKILQATAPAMYAVSSKNTISAIEGILFTASKEDGVTISTYDMEKGIKISVPCEVFTEGSYIINAHKFYSIIRSMNGEHVSITVDSKLLAKIECGRSSFELHAIPGADFPAFPSLVGEKGFVIGQGILKSMISKITHAIAENNPRPIFNGCFFKLDSGRIRLVSCDSFRLAISSFSTEGIEINASGSSKDLSFIVPGKTLSELQKLISDSEDTVEIMLTRKHIIFKLDEIYFFSRLIDSEYIDYERIIPKEHKITAIVDRDDMLSSLERAALVAEDKIAGNVRSHVKLSLNNNTLEISSTSATGRVFDSIHAEQNGTDIEIGFNSRYLIDTFKATDTEKVKISLTSSLMGINVEPVFEVDENGESDESKKSDFLFMLQPVRMYD